MAINNLTELVGALTSDALAVGVRAEGTSVGTLQVSPIADTVNRYTTGRILRAYTLNTAYLQGEYILNVDTYKVIKPFVSESWTQDQPNLQKLSYRELENIKSQLVPEVDVTVAPASPGTIDITSPELDLASQVANYAEQTLIDLPTEVGATELGSIKADVYSDDSTILVSSSLGYVNAAVIKGSFSEPIRGDIVGSVYADDSTVVIDGTTGRLTTTQAQIATAAVNTANIITANVTTGNITTVNSNLVDATTVTADTLNSTSSYLGVVASGIWNGSTLGVAYGGTGATTTQGVGGALDNLLPAGESAGYVLKTSGAGSYYWASETGAGGTVGTRIATQRIEYTATASQTVFTGVPTYTPGAGQLRVYVSGVRQNPSAYTETSGTSFTLSTGVPVGTQVFAEIDGFVSYPIAASDIAYSPIGGGSITGTTVQSAIAEIDTEKAPLASPTFTGTPSAPTAAVTTDTTQIATTAFVRDIIPTGIISMWYGAIASIPSGWALCDGTNGTPDLRNQFIIGAYADDSGVAKTTITGSPTQSGGSKDAITVAHTHTTTVTDPGHTHRQQNNGPDVDTGSLATGAQTSGTNYGSQGTVTSTASTLSATTGISVAVNSAGSSGTNANLVPYYALAYIMKL